MCLSLKGKETKSYSEVIFGSSYWELPRSQERHLDSC